MINPDPTEATMPEIVAVGDKLPDIQSKAKTVGNAIALVIGAGLITLIVSFTPDDWDQTVLAIGAALTGLSQLLITFGTRNNATVPLIVNPGPAGPVAP
jgi:hypothetical protein